MKVTAHTPQRVIQVSNCTVCGAAYEPYTPDTDSDIFGFVQVGGFKGAETKGVCPFHNPKSVYGKK